MSRRPKRRPIPEDCTKGFLVFKDGHKEEVLLCNVYNQELVEFSTSSGFYKYQEEDIYTELSLKVPPYNPRMMPRYTFYKLEESEYRAIDTIERLELFPESHVRM